MENEKKCGPCGRKEFVRTHVPMAELISGAVILLLIGIIGFAIYRKGQHYDPHLYQVRTEALRTTAAAVEGKAGTVPAENQSGTKPIPFNSSVVGENSEDSTAATKSAFKNEPLDIVLAGTKPMGETEFYSAENLYEKIDGRAPVYQRYNVQQLRCRSFGVSSAPGSFVDVYEYRFDNPIDAFGMFALERDVKGKRLDFVAEGYSGEMGFFFRQGAVYVQIIASDTKPATLAIAGSIAGIRAKNLPADDSGLAGRRKLPNEGLIADTVAFVPENAQGQSTLKNVFQAKYKFDGTELTFFVMVAPPDNASKAWQSFRNFCVKFGTIDNLPDANGASVFRAQLFGKWKVVYQRAGELGGVFDAEDAAQAQAFVEKYLRGEMK